MKKSVAGISLAVCLTLLGVGDSSFGLEVQVDIDAIGRAFRFPADELQVDDMMSERARFFAYQTAPQRKTDKTDIVNPDDILASKWIRGKRSDKDSQQGSSGTFFPIMITIAKQGTFLSAKTQALLDDVEKRKPLDPTMKPFGRFSLGPSITGGLFAGNEWAPSNFAPNTNPHQRAAIISEIRDSNRGIDVRIACVFAQFADLMPVPGGEDYYAAFGPKADEAQVGKGPPIDITAVMKALSQLISAEIGQSQPSISTNTNKIPSETIPTEPQRSSKSSDQPSLDGPPTRWWALAVIVAAAGLLCWMFLKKRT
jgi:hypothetical protein